LREIGESTPSLIASCSSLLACSTYYEIRRAADDVAAVIVPEQFFGVGPWDEDFSQASGEEVRQILARHNHRAVPA
jgi:predicted phosphoribosyltransferase